MTYSLTWMPKVLTGAGLHLIEQPGWQTRGHGDAGKTLGVILHHTAGARKGNMGSLNTVANGRGGPRPLPGPLCNLGLGRDGTWYIVAAGLAYHAGPGKWRGVTQGNYHFIGIEAENTGLKNDNPWPDVQMQSYAKGVAAILVYNKLTAKDVCGHLEWALPVGRKDDPSFVLGNRAARIRALDLFRESVAEIMDHMHPMAA